VKFFCPRCDQAVNYVEETAWVSCSNCGLTIDLATVKTAAGVPQLPVVWDHTGEQIGPYCLEEVLGSGGMGTVYRAVDTRTASEVAVKLLYPQLGALPQVVERFKREARALRTLTHPRIVRFFEEGEVDGCYYLVMEYVAGENLERYLESHKPSPPEVLVMASQICEALAMAHAAGIVHRDLKPANIIMSKD
jgi:serine/threonine protein kinase